MMIRLAFMGRFCVLTHAELTSLLVFRFSPVMLYFLCVCGLYAGCRVSVSAECCGLVQGGRGDSPGEEVQHCPVWRYNSLISPPT